MANGRDLKLILKKVYNHESLVGVDLRNLYLSFINFSGLELRAANLEGCCLSHALLEDCDLTGVNLSNAKLDHASFNRARNDGGHRHGCYRRRRFLQGRNGIDAGR